MTAEAARTAATILEVLNAHGAELRRLGARRVGLFGSYRRNTPRPDSDIDILIKLAQPSFQDYMDIKFYLEDLLGQRVDLVLEDDLKPRLRSAIFGEVIYAQRV